MSVQRIVCPECRYELLYATLGSKGSYKTGSGFRFACARAAEIDPDDALTCTVLRAATEAALRVQFPGRDFVR